MEQHAVTPNECLYVFVSAFRPLYAERSLEALSSPIGQIQTFQYAVGRNVERAFAEELTNDRRLRPTVIVFADRFAVGGYLYTPLRNGMSTKAEIRDDRIHLTVRLDDWPVTPDGDAYTRWVREHLVTRNAPQLTAGSPENTSDGFYILQGEVAPSQLRPPGDGWRQIAARLTNARAFKASDEIATIFTRLSIAHRRSTKRVAANSDGKLKLSRGQRYVATLQYLFPLADAAGSVRTVSTFKPSAEIQSSDTADRTVGAPERSETYAFKIALFPGNSDASLEVSFPPELKARTLQTARTGAQLTLGASLLYWAVIVGTGLLWAAVGGYPTQLASTCKCFEISYYIAPFVQFVGAVGVLYIFGKK